jgi:NADH dehydrogenase FAD-containing subunit
VLLGGGHAHIEVLRDLARAPAAGVRVTLVTPGQRLLYTAWFPA